MQAVDEDYIAKKRGFDIKYRKQINSKKMTLAFERGHLTPSHINLENQEKERSTFTLTNAAPQVKQFNIRWYHYCESFVEHFIRNNAPGEAVYIMTGVFVSIDKGDKILKLNNRVEVPRYFWKAVCYLGNTYTPFGFAFVRSNNVQQNSNEHRQFMTLGEFASRYFNNQQLFGRECTNVKYEEMEQKLSSNNFNC